MRAPVRVACMALLVNVLVSVSLMRWLGHVGLMVATTVGAYVQCYALHRALVRHHLKGQAFVLTHGLRIGAAVILMAMTIAMTAMPEGQWDAWSAIERCLQLTWRIVLGAGVYGLALRFALPMSWHQWLEATV